MIMDRKMCIVNRKNRFYAQNVYFSSKFSAKYSPVPVSPTGEVVGLLPGATHDVLGDVGGDHPLDSLGLSTQSLLLVEEPGLVIHTVNVVLLPLKQLPEGRNLVSVHKLECDEPLLLLLKCEPQLLSSDT